VEPVDGRADGARADGRDVPLDEEKPPVRCHAATLGVAPDPGIRGTTELWRVTPVVRGQPVAPSELAAKASRSSARERMSSFR
jgi:hypothetical protein